MPNRNAESGFSLIELVVAMVVTMIITGAMYGLLAGGQNAFRREPEMTARQQAIRLGMARLQADVAIAGQKLPLNTQVFTRFLDGDGIPGPNGDTDKLELIGSTDCPEVLVRQDIGANLDTYGTLPSCYRAGMPVLLTYPDGGASMGWIHKFNGAGGGGGGTDSVNLSPGQQPPWPQSGIDNKSDIACSLPDPQGANNCPPGNQMPPTGMVQASIVRYIIFPDAADNIPSLWRSDTGGYSETAGALQDPTGNLDAGWRLVARGVEDLQVRYRYAACATDWCDEPPLMVVDTPGTTVVEVEVRLGARTVDANLAGATTGTAVGATTAVRGQLVSVMSPRAALSNLSRFDPNEWQ